MRTAELNRWDTGAAHVEELCTDSDTADFILYRHGQELYVGPYFECMAYVHNVCCNSLAWACAHEGYSLVAVS